MKFEILIYHEKEVLSVSKVDVLFQNVETKGIANLWK